MDIWSDRSCFSTDLFSSISSLVRQGYALLCEHKQRALAVCFVMLETISLVLDVVGQSRWSIHLAAFLLSVFGFVITILTCKLERTSTVHAEKQLGVVEIGFSVVQLIATILPVFGVKINNDYTAPVLTVSTENSSTLSEILTIGFAMFPSRPDYHEDGDYKLLHGDDERDINPNMDVKNISTTRRRKPVDGKLKQETEMSLENPEEEKREREREREKREKRKKRKKEEKKKKGNEGKSVDFIEDENILGSLSPTNEVNKKELQLMEPPVTTTVSKLALHCYCDGCIKAFKKLMRTIKGVSVAVDERAELVTVTGTMETKALAETLTEKWKKPFKIVPLKKEQ